MKAMHCGLTNTDAAARGATADTWCARRSHVCEGATPAPSGGGLHHDGDDSGVAEVPSADDTLSIHFRLAGSGSGRGHIWAVGAPGGVSWASPWGACARFGAVCAGQSADASTLPLGSYLTPEDEQILPRVDTIHFLNSECQRHGERVLHARKLRGRGLPSLHTASTANSTTPTSDDQRDVSSRPQARPCANQSEPR